jgi:hypothetical protein
MKRYSHSKEGAIECTVWRNRFGRGVGPVVRQTTDWMNEWMNDVHQIPDAQDWFQWDCLGDGNKFAGFIKG